MVQLLSQLESTLSAAQGIADKLRDHVSRIDHYMIAAADESRRDQVYHRVLPPGPAAWNPQPRVNTNPVYRVNDNDSHMRTHRLHSNHSPSQASSIPAISPDPAPPPMWQQPPPPQLSTSPSASATAPISTATVSSAVTPLPPHRHDFVLDDLLKFTFPQTDGTGMGTGDQEVQLPDDLLIDWPFDMGDAFDFLGGGGSGTF